MSWFFAYNFLLDWYPNLYLWIFNAEWPVQLYLFFFKLLMMPEMVIILNQISARITYKIVTYTRHKMLFWRNNFLLWVFCVFILYFIRIIFPNKYCQKWRERGLNHIDELSKEEGGFKAYAQNELITMFCYGCSCLVYCLFFRLVPNKYVHFCLNWNKSVYGHSRCHVTEK